MWRKACNNSACVEAEGSWLSNSNPSGNCVEVTCDEHDSTCPWVHLRDSKQNGTASQQVLVWPRKDWDSGEVVRFIPVPLALVPPALVAVAQERDHSPSEWYAVLGVTEEGSAATLYFDQGEVDRWESRDRQRFAIAR